MSSDPARSILLSSGNELVDEGEEIGFFRRFFDPLFFESEDEERDLFLLSSFDLGDFDLFDLELDFGLVILMFSTFTAVAGFIFREAELSETL